MSDFLIDTSTGDIDLSTNDLQVVTGTDATVQHLRTRLRLFQGEWFFDLRVGVPYFEQILVKNPNLVAVTGIFRSAIQSTPGVERLDRIDIDFDSASRTLTVEFTAKLEGEEASRDFAEVFII